jgi:sulfatase modifying factor 1
VGSHPEGTNQWGHSDLAGNVSEWTLDSVGPYTTQAVTNYADTSSGFRIDRGGSFVDSAFYLRAASRTAQTPSEPTSGTGFRCARMP